MLIEVVCTAHIASIENAPSNKVSFPINSTLLGGLTAVEVFIFDHTEHKNNSEIY